MAKLTAEERKKRLKAAALESNAARGQFNFRLEGTAIKQLSRLADVRGKAVSVMVREWVLEHLAAEEEKFGLSEPQKPIWEAIADIVASAPPGSFDSLPTDGAVNLDHYLYGAPKNAE